jgi:hypothetical protein
MPFIAERIPDALIQSPLDDGLVGLSLTNNRCYGMNATASHVWNQLDQPRSVAQVADGLCASFAVERDAALKSAEAVLRQLADEGLVRLTASAA